jgi:hypothetical protein
MSTDIKYCNCGKCSCLNRDYFVGECDIFLCDRMLRSNIPNNKVCGVGVKNGGNFYQTAIEYATNNVEDDISWYIVAYMMTYPEPDNLNKLDCYNYTPLIMCAKLNKPQTLKLIIDFGGDIDASNNAKALFEAKLLGNSECIEIIEKYKPSENDKIQAQSEAKQKIDRMFNRIGGRYRQEEIDKIFK